ncbi:MAG TPA: TauD/TfdA family dioxygenase [Candidatus Margulisiibacteriota bacterium]|nr:TauD/TfdA family dioxygenase [Candidatus Margulisiibacteriota bacterium]
MTDRFVPLTPRIGAKVLLSREEVLTPANADEIHEALERYGVLVFPEIGLDDEEQIAFSNNLGEIVPIGGLRPDGSRDPVYKISVDPKVNPSGAEYIKNTIGWHIDGLFEDGPPPKATLLSGRRLSTTGGQTEFCSTYAAYDDLPAAERDYYEVLRIAHTLEASYRATHPNPSAQEQAAWRKVEAQRHRMGRRGEKEHPVVWHHCSGRKSLVLGVSVDHVVGLPDGESRALLRKLSDHATRREIVYRHEWTVGDLLMWDNCGVMHRVIPYDADSGRLMHRTTLSGVEPIKAVERVS